MASKRGASGTHRAGRRLLLALVRARNPKRAKVLQKFFKTGPGDYAEGQRLLGLTVPLVRGIVREHGEIPLNDALWLLGNSWHEVRLAALLILVARFRRADEKTRLRIYRAYLRRRSLIDNWDLVDASAADIVGAWLLERHSPISALRELACDRALWTRRIAIIATFAFIRSGEHRPTFAIATLLLRDSHDLIHKGVGWMLREVGKRIDRDLLRSFLDLHGSAMPRTMLRYAIEHLSAAERRYYLGGKRNADPRSDARAQEVHGAAALNLRGR